MKQKITPFVCKGERKAKNQILGRSIQEISNCWRDKSKRHLFCQQNRAKVVRSRQAAIFSIDIMHSGGIRRGLHIDDDDVPVKDQYGGISADRNKTNFEKQLDDMLFGGFSQPPPRRRPASENKTTEQVKANQPAKPAQTQKIQASTNVPSVPTKPQNSGSGSSPPKYSQVKANVKVADSVVVDFNKSTDSSKGATQTAGNNTININPAPKIVVNAPTKPIITNNKKQPSILVPSNQTDNKATVINNIPIESQPVLPEKKTVNANQQQQKILQKKQPQPQPQPAKVPQNKKPEVLPSQPTRYQQPIIIDVLHPFSYKNSFNKPGSLRKLKKPAQDYKFAEENVSLHSTIDVVRPFETDRSRQRKLNDFDFKDYQFPNTSFSLGGEHKTKTSVWKKQNELAKTATFGKYIDPNDINPGILSNPHFVSTLSAIAESQANTKRLIEDQKANGNGFYLIRLFINSVWRYIAVDSTLPFIDNASAGIVSNPDSEFELSAALIEKAYAKSFGGYDTFSRVQAREHYLRDLTGAPVKKYSVQSPDFANVIKKAIAGGQIVVAVPNEKIASVGLNPNFSYTVINYTSKGSLELRNSFGTLEEKSKISHRPDGNFDLGAAQVKDFLSHILVTNLNTSYSTTTIQSRHRHGFYSSYNFKIRKETNGFLTVSQWDERLFPVNSGYEYSPFHLVLHRVEEDGHSTFVNAAFTPGTRNVDLQVNLTPGNYTVFVSANWKHVEYAYNLTFYGSEKIDFERVYTERVPNLISQSLENINLEQGRRTDLNKNSAQYFLYHPTSNFVILTVENTSERDAIVTADLSKVKFDHLILLTSHNNEENYSNKVGSEIQQYKQIPLTDRRWSVSLPSQHRFTWILAADQVYDEANPKAWGFS